VARSWSIVPRVNEGKDRDVYLVLDTFGEKGPAWRETDDADTERAALVRDLLDGQYEDPVRIVAFNTTKGWSRDVTKDIADELQEYCADLDEIPVYLQDFLKRHPSASRVDGDNGITKLCPRSSRADVRGGGRPPEASTGAQCLGLSLAPAKRRRGVHGVGQKGLVVTSIDSSGAAAEHGLKTGDVILNVDGKEVATVSDIRSALVQAKASGRLSVLMQVKTADATRFIAVPFAK
jgi:hypothetical protein